MIKAIYNDAIEIINYSIEKVLPNNAVINALNNFKTPKGKIYMIAIGKAAYTMAKETINHVEIYKGLVITKYNHAKGKLKNTEIIEAGHPVLDENSILAGNKAIELIKNLNKDDTLIFLVSGGGSALFEVPLIPLDEYKDINNQLLKCGANIEEINTIRKRLSKVKGGKFAKLCEPAHVFNIILSDIINDPLDMISSGPTVIDNTNGKDALLIVDKYDLKISNKTRKLLKNDGIKELKNVETYVSLNNESFKLAAKEKCKELGYNVQYINKPLVGDISVETEKLLVYLDKLEPNSVIIAGGEIVLKIKGQGLGGRNQEFALRLGKHIKNDNEAIICIGSDGTDGPSDAAGAYVDKSIINDELTKYLEDNNSYHYLEKYGGLIKTGPTGTNVCDLYMIIKKG